MVVEALKYKRKKDNMEISIYVSIFIDCSEVTWFVNDIHYKTSRQRNFRHMNDIITNESYYRQLNVDDKRKYRMKRYEEFVGRDKIEEAIMNAYEMIRPNMKEIMEEGE